MDNVISLYHASALNRTDIQSCSKPFVSFSDHSGYISSLAFCSQNMLFSTSGDSCARLWDVQQQVQAHTIAPPTCRRRRRRRRRRSNAPPMHPNPHTHSQVSTATLRGDTGLGMSCGAAQPASSSTFVTCEVCMQPHATPSSRATSNTALTTIQPHFGYVV